MHKSLPTWSFHSSVRQTVPKINKQIIEDMRNERVVEAMEERGREGKGREGWMDCSVESAVGRALLRSEQVLEEAGNEPHGHLGEKRSGSGTIQDPRQEHVWRG